MKFDVLGYVDDMNFKYSNVSRPGYRSGQLVQSGPGRQESLKVLNYLEKLPKDTELSIQDIVEWSKKNKTEVGGSSLYKNLNDPDRLANPDLKKRWKDVVKKLKINIRPQFTLAPTEENFKKLGKLLKDKSLTKDDIKKSFGLKPKSGTESFNNLLKAYEKSRKVKIPDTRFKPYRHKGTELAEKIVKTFKADDTMTVTALTEKFFPGRPEQRKSVIKILKEANVRQPQPIKKIKGPKTIEQIMSKRRRDKLKEKSVPAYERKIRGTKNAHLHHMMSKRFNVTTSNLGYAPPKVNAELLPKVEGVLESLYKKRENLLRKKPANWRKQLEDINVRGMNIVSNPKIKGYLNFKVMDPKTLKMRDHGVNISKTIDPAGLLEGKAIKDLTAADKALIELNRAEIMKREKGPPIKSAIPRTSLYSFPANLQDPKFLAKEALEGSKMVGRGISKALPYAFGPTGIIGLNAALGVDPKSSLDRAGIAAEAAFAPALVKGTISATDKIKNPLLRKVAERGSLALMSPAMALRAARIASPIGLASLAAEGLYHAGKKEMARRAQMSPQELEDFHLERQSRGWSRMGQAGGGITRIHPRRPNALPPSSGPMPEGLPSVPYRVRNTSEY